MVQSAAWHPRVFVGATSGSLNPQIPSPVYRPSPVAIEIGDGIGFALDGESLVVAPGATPCTMTGHLDDGTYPQRDFAVAKDGNGDTTISSVYDWEDYTMHQAGNTAQITNKASDDFSSTVTQNGDNIHVDGKFPAQRYDITAGANSTHVQGYDSQTTADVQYNGDTINIIGDIPERTFEITKTDNGFHVKGAYRFQDFDVTYTKDGFTIQGLWPQQHYVVSHAAAAAHA